MNPILKNIILRKHVAVFDSFDRSDNASAIGLADTGQAWESLEGTWGIASNKAYLASASDQDVVVVDTELSDATITCDITLSATNNRANTGIVVRVIDSNNYILCAIPKVTGTNAIQMFKREGGSFTALALLNDAGNVNGTTYAIKVVAIGTTIKIYRDNVLKLSHILAGADATNFLSTTKHGIRMSIGANSDDGNSRFDNFIVEAI